MQDVLDTTSTSSASAPVSADEPSALGHLMRDYVARLKHHFRQIFGGE